jgi:penicillin-binding protein 1A
MLEKETFTKSRSWVKPAIYTIWALSVLFVLMAIWVFVNISSGDLPTFEDLENPDYDLASVIFDRNGEAFGKYYIENREVVEYEDLLPAIPAALIATEDSRFYKHSGIDLRALFRVGIKTILLRKSDSGGGSTISQQLAKLLYRRESMAGLSSMQRAVRLIQTKLKEWITAVKLEKSYTKEEIIAMYLNKFEFINGAHGIVAASQIYFGKNQKDLSTDEIAVLIGMLKNPSLYNPARFPKKSFDRRNVVLSQMLKYDKIDKVQFDSLVEKPLNMESFKKTNQSDGPAPYFRAELTKWLKRLFQEESIKKPDGSDYNIYTDGLNIYTTIDLSYQKHAEQAVWEHMKTNQERYWNVWSGLNPWTYDADYTQRKIRANALNRRIKGSERYLALHEKFLGDIKEAIQNEFGVVSLSENIINRLDEVVNKKVSIDKLVNDGHISEQDKAIYSKIIASDKWPQLMAQLDALEKAFDTEFSKEVSMEIFDYTENGTRQVEMTPLDSVKYHNKILQAGLLSVEPQTGFIRAWVGGVDHKFFKFDNVNSRRQVGSTIKPFVYTTAMSLQGISPCQEYEDIQYSIVPGDASFHLEEEWSPSNANGKFTGNLYNLYQGLLYSKNSITVRLVKEMGTVSVIRELLDNVGIKKDAKHPNGVDVVPEVPSICLGPWI